MNKSVATLLPVLALASLACNGKSVQDFGNNTPRTGVWQGFVRDAKSGDFINFFDTDTDTTNTKDDNSLANQIWALVEGEIRTAKPCSVEDKTVNLQAGCFFIDSLPTGQDIPVFVSNSSYERFASSIYIEPTVYPDDDATNSRSGLLFADKPVYYGNVRLYPKGINYDYTIYTSLYDDTAIADVVVRCIYDYQNAFDVVGNNTDWYLYPDGDFNAVISATSDSDGKATIPGASLTKGGYYQCFAHAADTRNGSVVYYDGSYSFTAGEDSPSFSMYLYESDYDLYDVATNFEDSSNPIGSLTGTLKVFLNRPAQFVAGTAECQEGSYTSPDRPGPDSVVPVTATDVDNATAEVAESVTVSLDSTGTILSIVPVNASTGSSTDDLGVGFNFGGIYLQPQSGSSSNGIYLIGNSPNNTSAFVLAGYDTGFDCNDMDNLYWDDLTGGYAQLN